MVVGGMTQYLTQVQRMPKDVEKRLTKRIRKYIWKDEKNYSPVSEATLQAPVEEGGKKLLDLEARNQAIDVMWLKEYLNLGPDRALWGYIGDAIFAAKVPNSEKNVDPKVRINPFTQSWKTACGKKIKIKPEMKALLDTATTFQVRPEGLAFSREILRQMPIWYHRVGNTRLRLLNSSAASKCLRGNHNVLTVGDAERTASGLQVFAHQPTRECGCDNCTNFKENMGCQNSHDCFVRARELLDELPFKWDPRRPQLKTMKSGKMRNQTTMDGWFSIEALQPQDRWQKSSEFLLKGRPQTMYRTCT
jgi:hypothetical protein